MIKLLLYINLTLFLSISKAKDITKNITSKETSSKIKECNPDKSEFINNTYSENGKSTFKKFYKDLCVSYFEYEYESKTMFIYDHYKKKKNLQIYGQSFHIFNNTIVAPSCSTLNADVDEISTQTSCSHYLLYLAKRNSKGIMKVFKLKVDKILNFLSKSKKIKHGQKVFLTKIEGKSIVLYAAMPYEGEIKPIMKTKQKIAKFKLCSKKNTPSICLVKEF